MTKAGRKIRTEDLPRPVVRIPKDRLPAESRARDDFLQDYFAEWVPVVELVGDVWHVTPSPPPRASYYVDERFTEGLRWWSSRFGLTRVRDTPVARGRVCGVEVSLSDAWTLHTFSQAIRECGSAVKIVIAHIDDHEDLGSPRLGVERGALRDLITGRTVDLADPESLVGAIESGAVGIGSFLLPLLWSSHNVEIRHLRQEPPRSRTDGRYGIKLDTAPDWLLSSGQPRLVCKVVDEPAECELLVTSRPDRWLANVPEDALLLLHIDADYFSNRYDGDSDWRSHARIHDADQPRIDDEIDKVIEALRPHAGKIVATHLALSPGFFPAEFWQGTVGHICQGLERLQLSSMGDDGDSMDVRLVAGRGSPGRGGDQGGRFWHIFDGDKRAGRIWINIVDTAGIGVHPSLTIELNKASRGHGIGTEAYRLAALASDHPTVWLHMRKSNVASRRAAEKAGFDVVVVPEDRQLVMRWDRRSEEHSTAPSA
ncbi:GNAT family N-acetyltransferase [Pseudofrankia sp. BMG5.36]|uniref:GNAT family N-acetyltransferase n=1 Tax=Pseudofrankia sp. BMG5.36 TaxID=1834512 RepID=UPI00104272DD|nr:GNAT family N-acetyltransferase [Pseudofrankia sp. BMG5.36]